MIYNYVVKLENKWFIVLRDYYIIILHFKIKISRIIPTYEESSLPEGTVKNYLPSTSNLLTRRFNNIFHLIQNVLFHRNTTKIHTQFLTDYYNINLFTSVLENIHTTKNNSITKTIFNSVQPTHYQLKYSKIQMFQHALLIPQSITIIELGTDKVKQNTAFLRH